MNRVNDLFNQWCDIRRRTIDDVRKRKQKVAECDHLFVVLEKGSSLGGLNSSEWDYTPFCIECVHCNLTNKFIEFDDSLRQVVPLFFVGSSSEPLNENHLFIETFRNRYGSRGWFDENSINLISTDKIDTYHPGILYKLAISIKPDGTNDELAEIMLNLIELETEDEKLKICNIEDAVVLLERYQIKYEIDKRLVLNFNN